MHEKSLLFHNNHIWSKHDSNSTSDVSMGSYDGAEICELIGLFILNSLQEPFGKDVGLYRDDSLAILNTKSGRLCEKAKKDLTRKFNELGLSITALTNQQRTDFLDITFNLANNTYKTYRKPNDKPFYINNSSNHPPSILRELPNSINKRINTLSCDKGTFDAAALEYNKALRRSDFNAQLTYQPPNANTNTQRSRSWNVIWYNPPFSKNVKTNISHKFLQLIDKHFPPCNKLSKLFSRHTVRNLTKKSIDRHC